MAMAATPPNAYLRTKVMTASPAELRLMLLEGAIRFAEQARSGLERRDFEAVYTGVTRCQAILIELINALRPERDAELCDRLAALYTFMYTRLMTASSQRDASIAAEVLELLKYERETWVLLMKRLVREQAGGVTAEAREPAARPMAMGPTLSVQG
jgi:flagellar protein FliS